MQKKTFALALGGGGARGLAHVGVLEILEKNGMKPNMIAGTSMGGIVGAMYAVGYSLDEIHDVAMKLKQLHIEPTRYFNLLRESILKDDFIEDALQQVFGEKRFEDCMFPFYTVAVDLETGQEIVFSEGRLRDALRATVSIPVLFSPHFYQDRYLIDGGILNNVPLSCLRDKNPDVLAGVKIVNYTSRQYISGMIYAKYHQPKYAHLFGKKNFLKNFVDVRKNDVHLMVGIALRAMDIAAWDSTNKRIEEAHPDFIISPDIVCGLLEFNKADEAIEQGRIATNQNIPKLKELLG